VGFFIFRKLKKEIPVKKVTRWKSWAAIVYGFVAVTLGGFRNKAWSEDVAPPAAASGTGSALEQQVNQLDQEVKTLQQQVQATQQAHETRLTSPGQPTAQSNEPAGEATAGRSGFALQSDDGNFILRFQGLIQADGRFYTGSGANAANYTTAVNASGQAPTVSQFLLRRVRPILAGTLYHNIDFFFQPDFGGNTAAIYDAYLDVKPETYANLRAGKFKLPLGLERLQTDSYLTFAERGLTADLIPQRDTGLELYGGFFGNALTYQAAFTNGTADGAFTPDSDANNGKVGTLRVFAQPFKNSNTEPLKGLGLGLAGGYSTDGTALPTFKTATGQEQFFSYNAGVSFDGEQSHLNPEANYYDGPLGLYGEYIESNQVAQLAKVKTRFSNDAWQGGISWVLTGEKASYTGVQPNKIFNPQAGTWGAFELAARYQKLEIDPQTFTLGFSNLATSASRATAYTVGLNWYLNKFVKFVTDYEETWFEGGSAAGGTRPIERVIDTRWQLAF
jgi:phosphate-selective porin OprO/OprP